MKKVDCINQIIFIAIIIFLALGCKKEDPESITQPVTNLSKTGATLNGTVNPNGLSTIVTFEYGTTTNYESTVIAAQSPVSGNSITNVSADISGLTIGTIYHYRVKAENSHWTVYSSDNEFEYGYPPVVTTLGVADLKSTGATLNGNVNANGLPTTVKFEYGTTTSYGQTIAADQNLLSGKSITNVSADISGLTIGTTYHFRLKAENSFGPVYGSDSEFEYGYPPAVTTLEVTNLTSTATTLNGTANANGLPAIVTFEYGTTTSYGRELTPVQHHVTGNNNVNVSADISGLTLCATYHFRVKAENSFETVYGSDKEFKCGLPPIVTALEVTNFNSTAATLYGNVNVYPGSSVVTFQYGTTTDYGQDITPEQNPVSGDSITSVSADIPGLTPCAIYHFRVKAENSCGTSYSSDITAVNPSELPTLTTTAISGITSTTAITGGIITDEGCSAITERGVEWERSGGIGGRLRIIRKTFDGTGTGRFTSTLTGLQPNTTFKVRAYARNSAGKAYGNIIYLTTLGSQQ
jgi:hypothetical protein